MHVFIGVDVGTASARAGIFDRSGTLVATARQQIMIWHAAGDVVEQSSEDIWRACAQAVCAAMQQAGLPPAAVRGIGFDATCSLVVLDRQGRPLSVSTSGDPARNVIVWMDHRATAEARRINETADPVLRYVGGIISPEMQTPKILWLKKILPTTYREAGHFLDLADYLSFRATGSTARSLCTVTCKWTYLAHEGRWSESYFERIGLSELLADDQRKVGREIVAPGTALAGGLTPEAAAELGLLPGTPVGAALIDAHAGAVIFGGPMSANDNEDYVRAEIDWIEIPLREHRPFLGICLGAQMLARQLGARVTPHGQGRAQIGYYPIRPTAAGLALCPDWPDQVYHWHREGFELPGGAELLAEGDDFPVQAIRYNNCFGLQFHPDVTYAMMHRWTTRGCDRMSAPGARARHHHFADRAVYDVAERVWLKHFLEDWLRMPPSVLAQAAE